MTTDGAWWCDSTGIRVMKSRHRTHPGFTLLEIAVAIAVAGLFVLASIPSIVRYVQDYRLDGFASNIVSDLNLTKHKAIAEGNDYVVTLYPDENTYTILDDDNRNGSFDQGEQLLHGMTLPEGLRLSNGPQLPFPDNSVTMRPDGTASATGIITIINRHGRQRVLLVLASTGFAKKLREYNDGVTSN
jgi:prepilin-type N-terminal cleavage/methylation domain-containing protein